MSALFPLAANLRYRFHGMRLRTKLVSIFLTAVFIPLVVAVILFSMHTSQVEARQAVANAENAFELTYTVLSNQFEGLRKNASLFLNSEDVNTVIRSGRPETILPGRLKTTRDEIRAMIAFMEDSQNITRIRMFVDPSFQNIIDGSTFFSMENLNRAAWYQDFSKGTERNRWLTSEQNMSSGLSGFRLDMADTLSYAVKAVEQEQYDDTRAVLIMDVSKSWVEALLGQTISAQGGSAFLIDRNGAVVASVGVDPVSGPLFIPDVESLTNLRMGNQTHCVGNTLYCVNYQSFYRHPWSLVTVAPLPPTGLFAAARGTAAYLTYGAFGAGILVFFTSVVFTKSITDRIAPLTTSMKGIKSGSLARLESSHVRDEIGELIDDYNDMVEEMEMLIEAKYLAGIQIKTAELRALQAHINPHFLYNTLELVNCYAYDNDPESVETIIHSLSAMYRLTLNRGRDTYQVWQELKLVEAYFQIQSMRYPGALHLEIDVPSALLQYSIPKTTLQPLVENSITHGILLKEDRQGAIKISGAVSETAAQITVTDNGAGLSPDALNRLNCSVSPDLDTTSSGSHYGVYNIRERIATYYGPGATLHYEAAPGQGTTARLCFPRQ